MPTVNAQSHARNIWYIYRNGGHLIKFYMQIMVHLPPTNLSLPSTYAQTEIGKYEFVCTYRHNSLCPTPIYNKAIRDGKYLARHMLVLGNVHPIKIENVDIFFRDVISLLARVVLLLIDTAIQEVPMTNI